MAKLIQFWFFAGNGTLHHIIEFETWSRDIKKTIRYYMRLGYRFEVRYL